MKKFKNHQRLRKKYLFNIVHHKKPKKSSETVPLTLICPGYEKTASLVLKTNSFKKYKVIQFYKYVFLEHHL